MVYKINCLTCHKPVEVEVSRYGGGFVGVCPECKHLAYSENKKPYGEVTEQDFNLVGGE